MSETSKPNSEGNARAPGRLEGHALTALIGVAAMALILAVNFAARPASFMPDGRLATAACTHCGTIVAVRRSAHSVPVYFVDIQMPDGSMSTVRQVAGGFSVGDLVEINGTALTLRDSF